MNVGNACACGWSCTLASRCEVVRKCSLGTNDDYGRQHDAQPQPPEMFSSR